MPQALRLAVVMDPIGSIKYAKDTTLAMLLAAQARGLELTYLEQGDLCCATAPPSDAYAPLTVKADPERLVRARRAAGRAAGGARLHAHAQGPALRHGIHLHHLHPGARRSSRASWWCNRPQGLRDMNEKVYTAWFPQCCAPTLITRDMADMMAFLREHGKIVVKPLDGMGGRSIFVVDAGDKNPNVIFETLTDYGQRFAIVQRYIPEIVRDRRCARAADRWRAGALRARAHPDGHRQPRQPRRRRQGRRPAADRARSLARRRRSGRRWRPRACSSSGSTSSAASSPRSTSPVPPASASSTSNSIWISAASCQSIARSCGAR